MKSVIPGRYFFDFTFQLPKRVPPIKVDGSLEDWSEHHLVPDLMHLRGAKPFADVYFSWNDDNIYIGLNVRGKKKPVDVDTKEFWRKDCLEVWIDLRNDKTHRRYSEHCHHFFFLPKGHKENKELATAGECREPGGPIQDTIYNHEEIEVASITGLQGYSLEARIPKSVIPTCDAINHPVIGFNYHLNDVDRRTQWWSCGTDFPRHVDPSTWGSIELIG